MTTVIVGGGLAGLAAAVELTAKGERVTLLESRSFCGGRAYSYSAPVIGDTVDNGQHVLLGCYHATLKYLSLIGSRDLLDIQPQLALTFLQDADHASKLHCPRLPSPLHLLAGIFKFCGVGDAWALLRHRHELLGEPAPQYLEWDQMSVAAWLERVRISQAGIRRFWEPLVLAVMNDAPERVSAAPFLTALHRIVSGSPEDASLAVSRVGLSDLFVAPALRFLEEHGSAVRTGVTVAKVILQDDRIVSLSTVSGENIPVSKIIFAIPPQNLEKLLADIPGTIILREMLSCWDESPILSVYLWYDRPVVAESIVGLWGSKFHWVFNRHVILSAAKDLKASAYCATLVVSGASDFEKMSREDVVSEAIRTMNRYFPKSLEANLLHRLVSREPHATVRLAPGTQRLRAAIKSPWSNAQFIGDWTNTHLPATIEGAIASGLFLSE